MAAKNTPNIKTKTTPKPSKAGIRLFIRSVFGSACPIPPHTQHGMPKYSLPLSSFSFMQTAQDCPFTALLQEPIPEQ